MSTETKVMQKVQHAIETETCPECGEKLNFEFGLTTGWSYTCPKCKWACGGSE